MTSIFKTLLRNFFASNFFNFALKIFGSPLVYVKKSQNNCSGEGKIAITIDCESGYMTSNKKCVWMLDEPFAFKGYYDGIGNLLNLLEKYNVKATFFLSTQCFSAKGRERAKIIKELRRLVAGGHELGLHLHPKEDFALQNSLHQELKYSGAKFYSGERIEKMIISSKKLIEKNLGRSVAEKVLSFRFGNFTADAKTLKIIEKLGFRIDSSACPECFGHKGDDREYDWRNYSDKKFEQFGNLEEIPISTFWFLGWQRADPSLGVLAELAFKKHLEKSGEPFILITHSSEATMPDGKPTYVIENLEKFIINAKDLNVEFLTLNKIS